MSNKTAELSLKETSDFACLLELMMPMKDDPQFACLPELFAILGYEKLLLLSRYAGGTQVKIPTVEELNDAIESLQWFYDIHIAKIKKLTHAPFKYRPTILRLEEVYKDVISDS